MGIDYAQESLRLAAFVPASSSEFWKPKAGQYTLQALSEVEDTEPFVKEGEEPKPRAKLDISIADKSYTWTFGKGVTPASTYGQLINLALNSGGSLKDKTFMVVVVPAKGRNNVERNTYTIVKI